MRKPHNSLNFEQRKMIESLKNTHSQVQIAKIIGSSISSVNREFLLFEKAEDYTAEKAQENSINRKILSKERAPLTLEQRKMIQEMLEKGCSVQFISLRIGRTAGIVRHEITIRNIDGVYNAEKAHAMGEITRRALTSEEVENILELHSQGHAPSQIAYTLHRSIDSIRNVISGKTNREKRVVSDQVEENSSEIEERISSLEMQIEIVIEQLNLLTKGKQ